MLNVTYSVSVKMDGDLSLFVLGKKSHAIWHQHTKRGIPRVKIFMNPETGIFLCKYIPILFCYYTHLFIRKL